jgi:hypothetical protein
MINVRAHIISNLIHKHYSLFCGVIICVLGIMFSLAETGYNYRNVSAQVFLISMLCSFLCKVIPAYIIFVILLRKLLKKEKYAVFWIISFMLLMTFVLLQIISEGVILRGFDINSYRKGMTFAESAFDILSGNAQCIMVMLGFLLGISFRFRSDAIENRRRATTNYLKMKVRLLKKQVSPDLLCDTVHNMGTWSEDNPEKASGILMKLSRLLRYQLYDGKREMLLLDSEMKFLNNYLSLMADNGLCDDYKVEVMGKTMGVMVPSMLFIPIIHLGKKENNFIHIKVIYENGLLEFCMKDNCDNHNVSVVEERLECLYPEKFRIRQGKSLVEVKVKLS